MGWIVALILLVLLLGGFGFAWHALWVLALVALVVVVAMALTRGSRL